MICGRWICGADLDDPQNRYTPWCMNRTQIYLTPEEVKGVARVAAFSGRNQSEVIREAIDHCLARFGGPDPLERLRAAAGMWSDRDDIDFETIRKEFDRF